MQAKSSCKGLHFHLIAQLILCKLIYIIISVNGSISAQKMAAAASKQAEVPSRRPSLNVTAS